VISVVFQNGVGGFARKVKFESIVMRNVTNPIIVDQGNSDDPADSSEAPVDVQTESNIQHRLTV